MDALGAIGFVLLLAHVAALVALVIAVARAKKWRAALALVFPPAAVVWGWEAGARARVFAYGVTLALFASVVTAIVYAR